MSGTINSFLIGQDPPYPPRSGCIETVNSGTPPTCVVVATADELLGTEDSYELAKLVGEAGVESKLYVAQDMVSCNVFDQGFDPILISADALCTAPWHR